MIEKSIAFSSIMGSPKGVRGSAPALSAAMLVNSEARKLARILIKPMIFGIIYKNIDYHRGGI